MGDTCISSVDFSDEKHFQLNVCQIGGLSGHTLDVTLPSLTLDNALPRSDDLELVSYDAERYYSIEYYYALPQTQHSLNCSAEISSLTHRHLILIFDGYLVTNAV